MIVDLKLKRCQRSRVNNPEAMVFILLYYELWKLKSRTGTISMRDSGAITAVLRRVRMAVTGDRLMRRGKIDMGTHTCFVRLSKLRRELALHFPYRWQDIGAAVHLPDHGNGLVAI